MKYKSNFQFKLENKLDFESRLHTYFNAHGFEIKKEHENQYKVSKNQSFWIDWKFNPLDWESQILIEKIEHDEVLITYQSNGTRHFNPEIHQDLFVEFLNRFISFVNTFKPYKEANELSIKKAKKKLIIYIPALIFGMAIGFILGKYIIYFTDFKLLGYIAVVLSITLSMKLTSLYLDHKYLK
jgi:hypothetical protein